MTDRSTGKRHQIGLPEAAELLHLPEDAVLALADAGFLARPVNGPNGLLLSLADVKAFGARNADNGSGNLFLTEPSSVDPEALLEALDGRTQEMAVRAFEIFSTVFPEVAQWTLSERARFIEQAQSRFEAILAVTSQGAEVDEALVEDLQEVGAAAAWAGSPLPHLLVILRISRDLVVQTAVQLAEERGRHWNLPLSLLLTRVLPAMDRLTDSLAQGYWSAMVGREEESRRRHENVVESSSDGVYEVDLDGRIQYANPSLELIIGEVDLVGRRLSEVLRPLGPASMLEALTIDPPDGAQRLDLPIIRADGIRRVLDVRTHARKRDDDVVGFQGVVRDVTAVRDLEADKNRFLALVTSDIRQPVTTILGLGATLEAHAGEIGQERVARIGRSIHRHAERIARLADDLHDVSRLESQALLLNPRPVRLRAAIEAAMHSVSDASAVQIEIDRDLEALADARRLEQVVANLVENALEFGEAPVTITAERTSEGVEVAVVDAGQGVPDEIVPTLFDGLRIISRASHARSSGMGLGLSLVKGLVEAMGGRVSYERAPSGGACFRLLLLAPRVRPS